MRPKIKIYLIIFFLVISSCGIYWKYWYQSKNNEISYETISVSRGTLRNTILSSGTVAPQNRLDIKPPIPGRIEQILVSEGQRVKRGQVIAYMSSTERAALLDAAKAKGEAEVKYWEDAERPTPLIAPISGVIILKNSEQGQVVTSQDAVLTMSDRLIVKAVVDETDIAQVKNNQSVEIVLDAYSNKIMPGRVVHIAYDAKTVSNVTTYEVLVLPNETPTYMKSGMTANVNFIIEVKENALYLPTQAVKKSHGKSVVLMPNPNGKGLPIEHEFEAGITDGSRTEILEGLSENETIMVPNLRELKRSGNKPASPFSPMGSGPGRRHP